MKKNNTLADLESLKLSTRDMLNIRGGDGDEKTAGGSPGDNPGGGSESQNDDPGGQNHGGPGDGDNQSGETVSREAHKKLLNEKKQAVEELRTLKAEKEAAKEKELKEKGEYKTLLEEEKEKSSQKDELLKGKEAKVLAMQAGFHDPADILNHIDEIEFDENFCIVNGDAFITQLKEKKSYLFKSDTPNVPATENRKTGIGGGNQKAVRDMTDAEYQEYRKKKFK